jgi:hypothetical protein
MNTDLQASPLCLKNIYELLGEHFFIPSYQRGYRWSELQVTELLNDLWEFSQQATAQPSAFYCLQPIVVVRRDNAWELVDGQQRLTTLYIILHYLEKEHLRRTLQEAYKKPLYTISYETRPQSADFLKDIQPASAEENIDFFYIAEAYRVVCEWFEDRDYNENNQLLATLLAKPESGASVKVIWYDLTADCANTDYAIDVFTRINIGKIPLTNAELVKALFLKKSHFAQAQASLKQIQIATEWDAIEKQLQEPAFWHFINKSDAACVYDNRIEYIFDLIQGKKSSDEPYFTFHHFHEAFKHTDADADSLWQQVKDYFLTFDEWNRDRELYHLIGFLVDCGVKVSTLKEDQQHKCKTKSDFKNHLQGLIRQQVACNLDELEYGNPLVKKVLLLFNIQTLLATQEADVRFPFDRYRAESWDIEHIHSQTSATIHARDQVDWLTSIKEYCQTGPQKEDATVKSLVQKIEALLEKSPINQDKFLITQREIETLFNGGSSDNSDSQDDIGNLTLLDSNTNRSYKNAIFPIKRARIIKNDMNGIFVPIGTKNVFLKFYSQSSSDLHYWRASDAADYKAAIASVLSSYLPEQGVNHE